MISAAKTAQRLAAKTVVDGDCHRWTGAHNKDGYGQITYLGKRCRSVHIVALLLAGIEIPPGMTVDHVWARGCRHRDCVRLDHLEVVTNRENTLRGRSRPAVNARKTHCIRGHEFTPENTFDDGARRRCRPCRRQLHREKYRQRRVARGLPPLARGER